MNIIEPWELKSVIYVGYLGRESEFFIDGERVPQEKFEEVEKRKGQSERPHVTVYIGNKLLRKDKNKLIKSKVLTLSYYDTKAKNRIASKFSKGKKSIGDLWPKTFA